jgi:hypothetical protein
MVDEPWPAQLNKLVWSKRNHDPEKQAHKSLVLSIGQVVPHEGKPNMLDNCLSEAFT